MKGLQIRKVELPRTERLLEVSTESDYEDVEEWIPLFSKACEVVDAQFYYTNPLMFVPVDEDEVDLMVELYQNYYLIPPKFYDRMDLDLGVVAVNQIFLEIIGSLATISQGAGLVSKHVEYTDDVFNEQLSSLFALYEQKGLYIIGVLHGSSEKEAAETESV